MSKITKLGAAFISAALVFILAGCGTETTNNELRTIAGNGEAGFEEGNPGTLNKPIRFTPYKENSVIFADINNHAIRSLSLDGEVKTIAGGPDKQGYADGPVESAKFNSPHGVAYDPATGIIYVASASNHVIRMLTPQDDESYMVSTLAGVPETSGYADGQADSALFNSPHCVVVAPKGGIYSVDIGNGAVRKIKDGMVSTVSKSFTYPMDLVMDGEDLLVIDAATNKLSRIEPGQEAAVIPLQDTLSTPHGVAVDCKGIIYEADMGTGRVLAIDTNGEVSVFAGSGENGTAPQQLNKPAAVLVHAGHLWIADLNNHMIKIIEL